MTGSSSRLSRLQEELLRAFAAVEPRFVLSGGGALVGFHLRHRSTHDLDFFCADTSVDLNVVGHALVQVGRKLGAELELLQSYPNFRRYQVSRGEEVTVVDLVLDATPRLTEPQRFGPVLVDTIEEIAANKLCTLVGRAEIRDLVDLCALLDSGIELTDALQAAQTKEGGVDAATLAWLLDEMHISEDVSLPGDQDPAELDRRRRELVRKLRLLAFPGSHE